MKLFLMYSCVVLGMYSSSIHETGEIIFYSDGIIFHLVLNISIVSVVSDKTIFYVVSKIIVANVATDGIIFHVVMKTRLVSVVSHSL